MTFKCPKCRGGNLRITEHFMTEDIIDVRDGRVVDRNPGEGGSLGRFSAECECGHRWRTRRETGERAVEAAQDL